MEKLSEDFHHGVQICVYISFAQSSLVYASKSSYRRKLSRTKPHQPGVVGWAVDRHDVGHLDVFLVDEVIYFSPDAEEELKKVDLDHEQGIRCYKLPMPTTITTQSNAKVLNIDHVVLILGHFLVEQKRRTRTLDLVVSNLRTSCTIQENSLDELT
eukprot:scaffold602_cov179-Ochromonas_danica.AAC.11